MKRPPALSDSLIYTGDYNFQSNETFMSEYREAHAHVDVEVLITDLTIRKTGVLSQMCDKINLYIEFICDYLIRFVFHITLISIFETIFFFMYVSVDEDEGILSTTNYYTNSILNNCRNLTENQILMIDDVLELFVNTTTVSANGYNDFSHRTKLNQMLQVLSWNYVVGLFCFLCALIGFAKWRSYKLKWVSIICENIVLVSFLGAYEYMFFNTIVKNYLTETPGEISAKFIGDLQNQCNLLKN